MQALTPQESALVNNLLAAAIARFPTEPGLFDREVCARMLRNAEWTFDRAKSWLGQQASLLRAQKTLRWNEEHDENMPLAVPDQVYISADGPEPSCAKYQRVLGAAVRQGSSFSAVSVRCGVLAWCISLTQFVTRKARCYELALAWCCLESPDPHVLRDRNRRI